MEAIRWYNLWCYCHLCPSGLYIFSSKLLFEAPSLHLAAWLTVGMLTVLPLEQNNSGVLQEAQAPREGSSLPGTENPMLIPRGE